MQDAGPHSLNPTRPSSNGTVPTLSEPVTLGGPRQHIRGHSFPRVIREGRQGLRSQRNHMIVTYVRHAEYTRAVQAGQADRSHACGYINNCTCCPHTRDRVESGPVSTAQTAQRGSTSTSTVGSTRPFRARTRLPPHLTAHLSPLEPLSQGRQK